MSEEKINKALNNKGISGYVSATIARLDKEQLGNDSTERSDFNAYKELDDVAKDFGKTDRTADPDRAQSSPELPIGKSMDRYCHEHSFDPETLVQGQRSSKTNLGFAKTDPTADKQ